MKYQKNSKSDSDCRSLLQKAVRRAAPNIARLAAIKLIQDDDLPWLRSRLGIIATEECWPEMSNVNLRAGAPEILAHFESLSNSTKDKSAAGLGSLSYELSLGDTSVLEGIDKNNQRDIKIVAEALKRPDDFWRWTNTLDLSEVQLSALKNCQTSYKLAGWPWDKSFSLSAAYLALSGITNSTHTNNAPLSLPYWVAIDKHTPTGKRALSICADKLKINKEQLGWIQFYLESAKCANLVDSFWWQHEKDWRFKKHLIDSQKVESIWELASSFLKEHLQPAQESLQRRLESAETSYAREMKEQQNLI